jgi:3-hydroxyisobutyrate dehydrogenase-like beta-hydroxyacid dehydrogenase
MNSSSRRRFLGVAGAGAAVVGLTAAAPGVAFASPTARSRHSADEPVVAYVGDAGSGELTLLVGEREVVVHDRDLVNRLLNAAGR